MISKRKQNNKYNTYKNFTKCKSKYIKYIKNKSKNIKHKTKYKKNTQKLTQKLSHTLHTGSGFFDSLGKLAYHKPAQKSYKVTIPGEQYVKMLNPESIKKMLTIKQPKLLTVIFNYRKPNQLNLDNVSSDTVLSSGQVQYEPYITIDNMSRYLVIMYDTVKKKMHWVIEFKNRSKVKTMLAYLSPKPKDGTAHKYIIQLIKYPDTTPPLQVLDMSTPKRRKMFRQVFNYIKTNNLLPAVFTKGFNVKLDMSSGMNIFNMLSQKKQTQKQTFKPYHR